MRCDWLEMPAGGRCELDQGHEGPHRDAEAVWRGFSRDALEAERVRADAAEARAARLAAALWQTRASCHGRAVGEEGGTMAEQKLLLSDPRVPKDTGWAEKIAIAKQARQAGEAVRKGKSPVVPEPKLITK